MDVKPPNMEDLTEARPRVQACHSPTCLQSRIKQGGYQAAQHGGPHRNAPQGSGLSQSSIFLVHTGACQAVSGAIVRACECVPIGTLSSGGLTQGGTGRQVITSAEFHPIECHTFAFASSKGCIRLADLRASALADRAVRTYEEVRRVVKVSAWGCR